MEFHISRKARDNYQFDQSLFTFNGNIIFADFHAAREFAQKINQKRDLVNFPEKAASAGDINAMGLIDEIMHYVISLYREDFNPELPNDLYQWVQENVGEKELEQTILEFSQAFPAKNVYQNSISVEDYLLKEIDGVSNRAASLEELLMMWIANQNPALKPYLELFDDSQLKEKSGYNQVISAIQTYFENQPPFGPDHLPLVEMLLSPSIAVPDSLLGQLDYIRERWGLLLGHYLYRLLSSMDLIKEEQKMPFTGMGPGPIEIPVFDASTSLEAERFSPDRDWMPRLVLMAKHTYVWLSQLSKTYGQEITRLDQIPDRELDLLAQRGFTGLWLIGLWERSKASADIKHYCGNPEAIASAYSLASYQIADSLGGKEAYEALRHRSWMRGIRLGCDMVPNHMGIDSSWVVEHPEWFISLDQSPFPSYTFNGPNLSNDSRAGIYLEDHYYNRSDAAVTFKHVDHRNGQTRYIYHGNDGTSMPWNDTAQLNYLDPNVREAVIQTILQVARETPIIRFDAAMTLTKKHYQRLWFPEPGTGGDIPSRAEHSLTKEQFNIRMPIEFWREVVDRIAEEVPDTLLLAEAFWLMESYFVRTLGMHRVYNSAFMNLLRDEDNANYRQVMKNTLEFDPEILKRYVNFMNNPDERTAIDQFGDGDKYFGICTLMATMPGLPMFGHGQIEGFSEKYGMEYKQAYWDEQPKDWMIERHQREIFPLMHRRREFSGIEKFLLYDFFTPQGNVDENVFAYSNGEGSQRNLVVYHNRFANTQGWIRNSVGFAEKKNGEDKHIIQRSLKDGLGLHGGQNIYLLFRDQVTGLEYIHSSQNIIENGMFFELNAYQHHVFVDIHEEEDDARGSYSKLCSMLQGRGVPSIEEAIQELFLTPVQKPFNQIVNPEYFSYLFNKRRTSTKSKVSLELLIEAREKVENLLNGIEYFTGHCQDEEAILDEIEAKLGLILDLPILDTRFPLPGAKRYQTALETIQSGLEEKPNRWYILFGWLFIHNLGKASGSQDAAQQSLSWMNEWLFTRILRNTYIQMGMNQDQAAQMVLAVTILVESTNWFKESDTITNAEIFSTWLKDPYIQRFLGVNRYKDVLWFNQEGFEDLIWWMITTAALEVGADPNSDSARFVEKILKLYDFADQFLEAEGISTFRIDKLLKALES